MLGFPESNLSDPGRSGDLDIDFSFFRGIINLILLLFNWDFRRYLGGQRLNTSPLIASGPFSSRDRGPPPRFCKPHTFSQRSIGVLLYQENGRLRHVQCFNTSYLVVKIRTFTVLLRQTPNFCFTARFVEFSHCTEQVAVYSDFLSSSDWLLDWDSQSIKYKNSVN